MILPLDYASLLTLDLNLWVDQSVRLLAMLGLPALGWLALSALLGRVDLLYWLALVGLGWSSALLRGAQPLLYGLPQNLQIFEGLCVFVPWLFVVLGLLRNQQQLWFLPASEARGARHNFVPILCLNAYLLLAALMTPAIYAVSLPFLGLALLLVAFSLAWSANALRRLLNLLQEGPWPRFCWRLIRAQEMAAWGGLAGAVLLCSENLEALSLCTFAGASLILWMSRCWHRHPARWALYVYTTLLLLLGLQSLTWFWDADGRGLLIAALALGLALLGWLGPFGNWRREVLHQLAIFLTAGAWLQISSFNDWSLQALISLALMALIYLRYAAHVGRNVFGYLGITVLAMTAFTGLSV